MVRAGFAARGLTYAIIGALAIALAVGAGSGPAKPNQQGALALVAKAPLGHVVLVIVAIGLLAYALWKLIQGIFGYGPEGAGGTELKDRVANIAGGIVYLVFCAVAVRILTGSSSNSSSAPRHAAAGVLGWPGGPVLVGIAGVVLIAIALYQIYGAIRGEFAEDAKTEQMDATRQDIYMAVGRTGQIARAATFAVVGYFVVRTAIAYQPREAVGIDGALARLHHQPFGPLILALVGAGLVAFALFSLMEAAYRRL